MVELVDTLNLEFSAVRRESSSLSGSVALTLVYKGLTSQLNDQCVNCSALNGQASGNTK